MGVPPMRGFPNATDRVWDPSTTAVSAVTGKLALFVQLSAVHRPPPTANWLCFSEAADASHSSQLLFCTTLILQIARAQIGFVWRSSPVRSNVIPAQAGRRRKAFRGMGVPPMSTTAASARDPQIGFVRTTANRRLPTAHRHLALFVQPFFNRLPTTGYCIVVTTSTIRIGANGTKETFSGKKRKRTQKEDSRRCAASFASSCGSCVSGARGLAPRWPSRLGAVSTYYRRFTTPVCSIKINIRSRHYEERGIVIPAKAGRRGNLPIGADFGWLPDYHSAVLRTYVRAQR